MHCYTRFMNSPVVCGGFMLSQARLDSSKVFKWIPRILKITPGEASNWPMEKNLEGTTSKFSLRIRRKFPEKSLEDFLKKKPGWFWDRIRKKSVLQYREKLIETFLKRFLDKFVEEFYKGLLKESPEKFLKDSLKSKEILWEIFREILDFCLPEE